MKFVCVCQRGHSSAALDISTGPLARRTFQTAGPVRASTFYLSLACAGHPDICRAIRFLIVLARTMTNHSMYFSRGRPPHISAVFAQSFCYSETPACRESELGMSIKHTLTSVCRSHRTRYFNANIRDASGHFSPRSTWHGSE